MADLQVNLKKIRSRGGLSIKAYRQLKEAIISGKLQPGQRLQEEMITEKLGISRTPLREALNRLNSEGLIQIAPKRGAWVLEMTNKELDDLFDSREVIETHFFVKAAERVPPVKFIEFKEKFVTVEKNLIEAHGQYEEWDKNRRLYLEADRSLHDLLVSATDNRYWEQLYLNIRDRIDVYSSYISHDAYWLPVVIKDHHDILDAVLDQKYEKGKIVMSEHIRHVRQGLSENSMLKGQN